MKIAGFQKVSTIDYPEKICSVIFLYGCNFRCGFCYNVDLVTGRPKETFSEEEILKFLEKRKGKLDGVCISGGEPLLTLEKSFVKKIKDLGYLIKLDTNGGFPDKLKKFIDAGLVDYIAMDIKGSKDDYSKIAGTEVDISAIEKSIKLINDFGNSEFRTTIIGRYHDENSVLEMAQWLNKVCDGKPNRIFLQGFRNNLGETIDKDFLKEENVEEKTLKKIKKVVVGYFGEVGVRF